jgi:hypothetical protein
MAMLLGMVTILAGRPRAEEPAGPERPGPRGQGVVGALADRPSMVLAQKSPSKKKKGTTKKGAEEETSKPAPEKAAAGDSGLTFSRDIAPILVGNCIRCHNPQQRRGKFDLTTFEKLMAGSDVEKVIEPGKPDESHLVLRIKGEETPKMPQGNNNNLAPEAIEKIEKWVQAGARLDAGKDPKAPLTSYAPTDEQLRIAELKKLPADQRDKMVEDVGLKRWKQASPKTTPEVTAGAHFLLFSRLPKDRASAASKAAETAYTQLRTILSRPGAPALDWAEKTSLFVFNNASSLVEFVRSQENRELDSGETGTANFGTKEPYVAVLDPLGGRDEPATAPGARKSPRARRGGDDSGGSERNLAGLLAEQLALGVLKAEGKENTPIWLSRGVGAYFAAASDPRSTYVHRLRAGAAEQFQIGWVARANDALGGQLRIDETRAVGYAIVDWMAHDPRSRARFPAFVQGMLASGPTKLDEVLQNVLNGGRQDLYESSGQWITEHYGR